MKDLDDLLRQFEAQKVDSIEALYSYTPSLDQAVLGRGSFGFIFRMKRKPLAPAPDRSPLCLALASNPPPSNEWDGDVAMKCLPKADYAAEKELRRLAYELAILYHLPYAHPGTPSDCPYLNSAVHPVLHTDTTIYIPLETFSSVPRGFATSEDSPDHSLLLTNGSSHAPNRTSVLTAQANVEEGKGLVLTETVSGTFDDLLKWQIQSQFAQHKNRARAVDGLPEEVAALVMAQLLLGLAFLHRHGSVHRDVKPSNILCKHTRKIHAKGKGFEVELGFDVQLADFGLVNIFKKIAKAAGERAYQTQVRLSSNESEGPPIGDGAPPSRDNSGPGEVREVSAPDRLHFDASNLIDFQREEAFHKQLRIPACGTLMALSLQLLDAVVAEQGYNGFTLSTVSELPKMDSYAAGVVLYYLLHGRWPYDVVQYRPVSKEVYHKRLRGLIKMGPHIDKRLSKEAVEAISRLMDNDPAKRIHIFEALKLPFFNGIVGEGVSTDGGDLHPVSLLRRSVTYRVKNGDSLKDLLSHRQKVSPATIGADAAVGQPRAETYKAHSSERLVVDAHAEIDIVAVIRGQEDPEFQQEFDSHGEGVRVLAEQSAPSFQSWS